MSKSSFKALTRASLLTHNARYIEKMFGNTVKAEPKPQLACEWTPNLLVKSVIESKTKSERQLIKDIKSDIKKMSKHEKDSIRNSTIKQIIDSNTPNFGSFHLNLV